MAKSLHSLTLMDSLFLIYFLFLLSLSNGNTSFWSSTQSPSHDDECFALFQFKQSFVINRSASHSSLAYPKVASWKLNASNSGTDCCLWDGVECTEEDSGPVIGLDLSSSFLHGPINSSNSLFNLIHLQRMNLSDNDFIQSEIPSAIGHLSQLKSLNLSFSKFSGQIPIEISQLMSLASLQLSDNTLKLQSPSFRSLVQNLTRLEELVLIEVNINSEVPDTFTNFTSLKTLYLDNCGLTGEFPVGIFHLPKLQNLVLWGSENLSGYLPEFHLSSALEILSIFGTKFSGSLPSSLNNLTKLRALELLESEFSGTIPILSRLSELVFFEVGSNKFNRSRIPDWLGKLTKLTYLYLRHANLYGDIPSSIANLTQLVSINLADNQLTGQFPPWLMNMTQLTLIGFDFNQLQGPIPRSFSSLNNLSFLGLSFNNFSGTVESSIFLNLKKLDVLQLGHNMISLVLTNNYTNATLPKFKILGLGSCNLRAFPDFLRFQDELMFLFLDGNKIDGQIPGSFPLASQDIIFFDVSNNRLTGEIPLVICQWKNLGFLDLSNNNMNGIIPPCLGNMGSSLSVLNLKSNNFKGTIPNTYTKECKLKMIDFSHNQLEGKVLRSLMNCKMLQYLDLGNNYIDGTFPLWMGGLSELQVLILRSNKFCGTIQSSTAIDSNFPKLRIVDLSNNGFDGDLPHHYFQSWKAMKTVDADAAYMQANFSYKSKWDYDYPYSMQITNKGVKREYEKIITIFKAIDLSSNQFRGKIPESIGSLGGIQMLNLSNNHLVGGVPLSMGNLTQLESLDISQNYLSGGISHQLAQLTSLSFLNVSNNNLIGPIPQGNQFNTFENGSYEGNPGLCGVPLSKKCGSSNALTPPPSIDSESFPSGVDWVVIFLGLGSGLVIGLVIGNHLTTRYHEWFVEKFGKWKGKQRRQNQRARRNSSHF